MLGEEMLNDERGLNITSYFLEELQKIAEAQPEQHNSMVKEEEIDEVTEIKRVKDPKVTSPGQMFGVQFSKMRDGSAKMSPLILPVPGYTFKPEMQKFVPNLEQPGWITTGEEMMARAKREGYIQAKKEETMAKMQQEAASFMDSQQTNQQVQPQAQPQTQQAQQPAVQQTSGQQAPQQQSTQQPEAQK